MRLPSYGAPSPVEPEDDSDIYDPVAERRKRVKSLYTPREGQSVNPGGLNLDLDIGPVAAPSPGGFGSIHRAEKTKKEEEKRREQANNIPQADTAPTAPQGQLYGPPTAEAMEAMNPQIQQKPKVQRANSGVSSLEKKRQELQSKRTSLEKEKMEFLASQERSAASIDASLADTTQQLLDQHMADEEKANQENQKRQQESAAQVRQQVEKYQQLSDNPPDTKLRRSAFWDDSNVVGKVGLIIGSLASGFLGKPGWISDIVQRDIEDQKFEADKATQAWQQKLLAQNNLVAMYRQMGLDDFNSVAAAQRFRINQVQSALKSAEAQAKGAAHKQRIAEADQQLELRKRDLDMSVEEHEWEKRRQQEAAIASAIQKQEAARRKVEILQEAGAQGYDTSVDVEGVKISTPKDNTKLSDQQKQLKGQIAEAAGVVKRLRALPKDTVVPGEGNIIERGATSVINTIRGPAASGRALTKEERELQLLRNMGAGMIANLKQTGIIQPSEEPGIMRQLGGGPHEVAEAIETMTNLARQRAAGQGIKLD